MGDVYDRCGMVVERVVARITLEKLHLFCWYFLSFIFFFFVLFHVCVSLGPCLGECVHASDWERTASHLRERKREMWGRTSFMCHTQPHRSCRTPPPNNNPFSSSTRQAAAAAKKKEKLMNSSNNNNHNHCRLRRHNWWRPFTD